MKTILIAADKADGRTYLDAHPYLNPSIIVTPRSPAAARGRTGHVYATPAARDHISFDALAHDVAICALMLPEHDRVA